MFMCVRVHTCMWRADVDIVILYQLFSHCFLGYSLNLELTDLVIPAGQQAPGIFLPPPSQCWDLESAAHFLISYASHEDLSSGLQACLESALSNN